MAGSSTIIFLWFLSQEKKTSAPVDEFIKTEKELTMEKHSGHYLVQDIINWSDDILQKPLLSTTGRFKIFSGNSSHIGI